ncbi:galactitol-1-phosphate 5-dehydrogenase [Paracoccus sediminis]|uniref:Galactitol-1-phosphate 5-dehydrogenase n=1 Tax=Paracoccus sediminis TaxID=1214787 RepID=A0A238YWL3_9RHOB|nr:alcohol dehydrogenase catalytic domain-containing protein [Paracoccus sediminis]TBN45495.1 galactitol-1-phosphate 5-dehydrogenase [Paracoccus sediminis]SNR74983.1 Threonine dehydrogenase [Paracoccus sediminis]
MKALVYTGARDLDIREVPDPVPAAEEVLLRVEAVGICGSDMHAWAGHDERRPAPLILGHEAAGTVLDGPMAGQRVTVNPLVTCGRCQACLAGRDNLCASRQIISMPPRDGAFAEKLAMPFRNLVAVPDGVSLETASLAEPLACGWHAVRLARQALDMPLSSARCLVFGGGAIGLGVALILKSLGAAEIGLGEPSNARRQVAALQGGLHVFDPQSDETPASVDLVIDGVGFGATRAAGSAALRPGGVFMHIGLGDASPGFDIRRATLQELTFIGTYTYTAQDFRHTATAIFEGRLGRLDWREDLPLDKGPETFHRIAAGAVTAPKVTLLPFA